MYLHLCRHIRMRMYTRARVLVVFVKRIMIVMPKLLLDGSKSTFNNNINFSLCILVRTCIYINIGLQHQCVSRH